MQEKITEKMTPETVEKTALRTVPETAGKTVPGTATATVMETKHPMNMIPKRIANPTDTNWITA